MKYIGSVSACTSREEATFTFEAPDGASADEIYAIAEREAMNHIDVGYRVDNGTADQILGPVDPTALAFIESSTGDQRVRNAAIRRFLD